MSKLKRFVVIMMDVALVVIRYESGGASGSHATMEWWEVLGPMLRPELVPELALLLALKIVVVNGMDDIWEGMILTVIWRGERSSCGGTC